jgi:hypothetical protein
LGVWFALQSVREKFVTIASSVTARRERKFEYLVEVLRIGVKIARVVTDPDGICHSTSRGGSDGQRHGMVLQPSAVCCQ